jgi:hypothetical protein
MQYGDRRRRRAEGRQAAAAAAGGRERAMRARCLSLSSLIIAQHRNHRFPSLLPISFTTISH